ncbi:hypothetical protein Pmani_011539 [Petrolisthes manimaculis]|uniref:Transposase Tc1-like domain-containing protein n=1 Tax=Petrolisthes manimaculis TaxID=1843537 RepID=A0AAE1Q299_9EUCA|nr:hypothetical protein Pmani_011539 [Petrolisthes manimaculis]
MGHTKLTMEEKGKVMVLAGVGLSNREIGRRLRRSETAIRRVKQAAATLGTGGTPQRKKGTGRKRKTDTRTDKMLERQVKKDPFVTAKELKEMYADLLGEVSVRTVQIRLQKDLKLPCRRAAQKPLLTKKMKKQRVDFCKRHADWTQEDWRRVMFSDESASKTISRRQKLVRRPSGSDRFDSHYTMKTVKFPAGVMVWGSFSGEKGTGGLYFLNKNVNMNAKLETTTQPLHHHNHHRYNHIHPSLQLDPTIKNTSSLESVFISWLLQHTAVSNCYLVYDEVDRGSFYDSENICKPGTSTITT